MNSSAHLCWHCLSVLVRPHGRYVQAGLILCFLIDYKQQASGGVTAQLIQHTVCCLTPSCTSGGFFPPFFIFLLLLANNIMPIGQ